MDAESIRSCCGCNRRYCGSRSKRVALETQLDPARSCPRQRRSSSQYRVAYLADYTCAQPGHKGRWPQPSIQKKGSRRSTSRGSRTPRTRVNVRKPLAKPMASGGPRRGPRTLKVSSRRVKNQRHQRSLLGCYPSWPYPQASSLHPCDVVP